MHTRGSDGDPLRPHNEKNLQQAKATLDQYDDPKELRSAVEWFRTLPFTLDMDGFRAVHAAWCEGSREVMGKRLLTDDSLLQESGRRGTPEYEALERLLKGIELELPKGEIYLDKENHARTNIRSRWWENPRGKTYREMVFPASDQPPEEPVANEEFEKIPGYDEAKPVFVGHYWMPSESPLSPITPKLACLDYSVAKGGKLVAYRWSGEDVLVSENFVGV